MKDPAETTIKINRAFPTSTAWVVFYYVYDGVKYERYCSGPISHDGLIALITLDRQMQIRIDEIKHW